MREALAELLIDEGYRVRTAAHGGHALAALQQGPAFALVLLDLVMPEVSGLQFRAAQLQRADWAQIPTMVLTADVCAASNMPLLRGAMLAEKPLNLVELLRAVRQACSGPRPVR